MLLLNHEINITSLSQDFFNSKHQVQDFTMRYSIMLQLVGLITLVLIGMAASFAWLQNRPAPNQGLTSEVSDYRV